MIATGRTPLLGFFLSQVFASYDLNWKDHVQVDKTLFHLSDIRVSSADPGKAREVLGWIAQTNVEGAIKKMCEAAEAF